jgi:argonaute-like protein implicated in RNA metabolism and viral defense
MFHTSGLKGVVQYVFKRIQQKHIPLTNFVVFANVTLLYSEEGKCNILSGKISNELVQITDDNRQIRLF